MLKAPAKSACDAKHLIEEQGDPEQCLAAMKQMCGAVEHAGEACYECIHEKPIPKAACEGTGSGEKFCAPSASVVEEEP